MTVPDDPITSLEYYSESGAYCAEFDSTQVSTSVAVISVLSTATGNQPTNLPPLGKFVDVEAVERLVDGRRNGEYRSHREVAFTYREFTVRVTRDGSIEVETQE